MMTLLLCLCAGGAARGAPALAAGAWGEGGFDGREPRLEARLLVHPDDATGPRGLRVGVLFDLDPGWHLYWHNPGDSGLPTRLRWYGSAGRVEAVSWPAPQTFRESEGELVTYGYAGQVLLAGRWLPAPGAGARVLGVQVDALVCNAQCLPVQLSLERALVEDMGSTTTLAAQDELRELFARFERRVPRSAGSRGWQLDVRYSQPALRPHDRFSGVVSVQPCPRELAGGDCSAEASALEGAAFFPYLHDGFEVESAVIRPAREGAQAWSVDVEARVGESGIAADARLRGVLVLGGDEDLAFEIDLPLPAPAQQGRNAGGEPIGAGALATPGLPGALALALLGGLLLNLMPCVFPVLALKGVALAELAGRSRREVVAHVCGYVAGILAALLALAGLVVVLRAGGTAVGWGFQLQEPRFVAALAVVLVVFAANLMGAFEITLGFGRLGELGAHARGATRSFCDGLLAVLLATPCSAPFLGTAVGFAFARSGGEIVAIFVAIGLGLAAPYVLLAGTPGAMAWLPRPGLWMVRLRSVLGFSVLGVVVWLVWILGRSTGVDSAALLLLRLWAVALLAWSLGLLQRSGRWRPAHGLAAGICLVSLALAPVAGVLHERVSPVRAEPYESRAIEESLAAGQRVFVYFTADWCITCKVNERVVLGNERVEQALSAPDVSVFRADWTRRDERIRAALARYGRVGVPTYLVLRPHVAGRAQVLPELLTVGRLLRALEDARPPALARG
jgi:thiol:disulfide interchange protein/DsbC/DsbD-like thiol-disulfide interchange protein